ncbi:MAG: hypothetical protein FJ333_08165 [Sphingomonadales bacterium]|nr:hypothetical protein [Sphingomonadales bacterium]
MANDFDLNKRLDKIEKKQRAKEYCHIQKQKLLKYKLKLLKQQNQLSKLQSLVTNQNSSGPGTSANDGLQQLDGNNTDSDISSEDDDDDDDDDGDKDYVPPQRSTRSQASGPQVGTSSNIREKLLDSFAHFLDINNVTDNDSNDPLKVLSAFIKDSQKGKLTKGLKVKTSQQADESVSSQYLSAEDDDEPLVHALDGATATFKEAYVTAFELEIDSQPVDTLKITSTADESCEAYFRFLGKKLPLLL